MLKVSKVLVKCCIIIFFLINCINNKQWDVVDVNVEVILSISSHLSI